VAATTGDSLQSTSTGALGHPSEARGVLRDRAIADFRAVDHDLLGVDVLAEAGIVVAKVVADDGDALPSDRPARGVTIRARNGLALASRTQPKTTRRVGIGAPAFGKLIEEVAAIGEGRREALAAIAKKPRCRRVRKWSGSFSRLHLEKIGAARNQGPSSVKYTTSGGKPMHESRKEPRIRPLLFQNFLAARSPDHNAPSSSLSTARCARRQNAPAPRACDGRTQPVIWPGRKT